MEDHGRGADGGEPAAGGVLREDAGADAWVGAEVFHAGTAGKKNTVERLCFDGSECRNWCLVPDEDDVKAQLVS